MKCKGPTGGCTSPQFCASIGRCRYANTPKHLIDMKPKPPKSVTCIFCRKYKSSPRSLRQHWCPALPPTKGHKKHSAQLTKEQWQACIDAARTQLGIGLHPFQQKQLRKMTLCIQPWDAL